MGRHYGPRRGPVADRVNFEEISKTVTASGKTRCSYRCRQVGCEWAAEGVTRSAPQHHASKAHPEVEGIHVYSAIEGGEVSEDPEEVRRAKSAARSRKYRANKRQQQQQAGGHGAPFSSSSDAGAGSLPAGEHVYTLVVAEMTAPPTSDEQQQQQQRAPPTGSIIGVLAVVHGGKGEYSIVGNLRDSSREGVKVALTWAASHISGLTAWLGSRGGRTCLWRADEHLQIMFSHLAVSTSTSGRSLCVPVALSLVCFASGRKYNAKVAVTGELDLQGNILDVWGLEGKIEVCHRKGVSLLLIPATSLASLDVETQLPPELHEYARRAVRGYSSMTEAIQLAILDCPQLPASMPQGLRAGRVGVGYGFAISAAATSPFTVQVAAMSSRGGGSVEVTGEGSETMLKHVETARRWALIYAEAIAAELPAAAANSLSPKQWWRWDLHVHLVGGWEGMDRADYTAVVAVALVSFFTGRLPHARTAISGGIKSNGLMLRSRPVSTVEVVEDLVRQGIERLVVCDSASVSDPAVLAELRARGIGLVDSEAEAEKVMVQIMSLVFQ